MLSYTLLWLRLSPLVLLGATLGAAGLMLIWLRPYAGLHLFVATLFVENAFGEGLTAMKAIGAMILLGWLMNLATRREAGIRLDVFTLAVVLFVAWCGLSPVFAIDASVAGQRLLTFTQLVVASLMFRSVVDSPERLRGVYWSIVVCTWIVTILALIEYYLGRTPNVSGLVKNRNLMATYIDIAIVCAYFLHGMTRHRGARMFLASTLPVLFLGVALTFSRAGLVMLCFALVLAWYFVTRMHSFILMLGSMMLLLTMTFVLPDTFWRRAGSIVPAIQRQEDTFGTRVRLWRVGWAMVQDRPLTGVGAGNFNIAFPRYGRGEFKFSNFATHNAYVGMAAETGVVGLGLYLVLQLLSIRKARRAMLNGGLERRVLAAAATVIIPMMMIGALAGDAQYLKMLWMWLGLAAAVGDMAPPRSVPMRSKVDESPGSPLSAGSGALSALPCP
jgi:O-antigen ligase